MATRIIPFKYGQVVADVPIMVEQWDFEKNAGVDITTLFVTTKKPAYFWKCKKCGFSWKASVEARLYSTGQCPCCELNYYIVPGINDLMTVHPEAANVLDFERTVAMGVNVETLSASRQKIQVAWQCKKCGYKWETTVKLMENSKFRCPCCETRRVIVKGINDIFTLAPRLKDYYDFEKNGEFDIYHQGVSSTQKVYWRCPACDRQWKSSICGRIKGKDGNYTVNECPHFNTVKRKKVPVITQMPAMYKFWDCEKNTLDPALTPINSPETAFWKCEKCNYEWEATIFSREQSSHKCPSCELNLRVIKGVSDFFTLLPEAKKDYNFEKNVGIDIENLGVRSPTPVWWKCYVCGYEWKAQIRSRVCGNKGSYSLTGCAQCYHTRQQAAQKVAGIPSLIKFWDFEKNEKLGLDPNLISSLSEEIAHWRCRKCGYEWETQILSRKRGKTEKCPCCDQNLRIKKGVNDVCTIVPEFKRIFDFDSNKDIDITSEGVGSTQVVNYKCPSCSREWTGPINSSLRKQADGFYRVIGCPVCDNRKYRKTRYEEQYPDLVDFFDVEQNGFPLSAINDRKRASTEAYWWLCKTCGKSFQGSIHRMIEARLTKTKGCPFCAKRVMLPGDSFAEHYPEHMEEYSIANDVDPYKVYPTSQKSVEWVCRNNDSHVWTASFYQRSKGEGKCPICYRTRHIRGHNTLADKYPEIVPWWSPNNARTPDKVFYNTGIWYKWICIDCKEEFSAPIQKMMSAKEPCPFCADRKVLPGVNSFAVEYPDAAKLWSPNNVKTADQVLHSVKGEYLWICPTCSGEFLAPANEMAHGADFCPYCENKQLLPEFNSLAARCPEIAKQWSPQNVTSPDEHLFNAKTYHFWECPDCHGTYREYICDVVSGTASCPYCDDRRVLPGYNSLAALFPLVAQKWSLKNEKDVDQVLPSLKQQALWICSCCQGEYSAPIDEMVAGTCDCPYCSDRKVLPGYNSLAVRFPLVAQNWSLKNEKDADEVLPSLKQQALWICSCCQGEYSAPIDEMVAGTCDCPYCNDRKVLPGFNSLAARHPELMEEWSFQNNYLLANPDQLLPSNTSTKVWWRCSRNKKHVYLMPPARRLMYKKRKMEPCTYCKGRRRQKTFFV